MKKLLDHLHKMAKYVVYFKYTHLCWSPYIRWHGNNESILPSGFYE